MKSEELIRAGIEKAEGLRKLAAEIGVSAPSLSAFYSGGSPLPPYRAAQIAKFIGENELEAAVQALSEKASSDDERKFWVAQKKRIQGGFSSLEFLIFVAVCGVLYAAPSIVTLYTMFTF